MTIKINDNERIDDLQRNGYKIIQNPSLFCFGMDAVLLTAFAKVKKGEKVLDFCTGNGVIPILLEARTNGSHFTGLEIQDTSADLAKRSVELNGLNDKVDIVQGNVVEASSIFKGASFNVITCNPPYMNDNHGLKNPNLPKAIARHEVLCTLEDIIREASKILNENGRFYMVHRPHRLVEIITLMHEYKLEPKRMRMVYPFVDKEPNMVLIEGIKGANSMLKVEEPLVVYKEVGVYTKEVYDLYGND